MNIATKEVSDISGIRIAIEEDGKEVGRVRLYILKNDFKFKLKTIIGILYNEADKDAIGASLGNENNKLYFNCIMPLKEMFSIPYLLKNIIYKQRYDKYQMKKVMTEDDKTRGIISYADKILMSKVNKYNE